LLFRIIEWAQPIRPDAVDIPETEKLMRGQIKKVAITFFIRESEPIRVKRCLVQMLDAAAAAFSQMKYEGVVVVRNVSHHRDFGLDDLLHVAPHALGIVVTFAVDDDSMRHASHLKIDLFEVADFNR